MPTSAPQNGERDICFMLLPLLDVKFEKLHFLSRFSMITEQKIEIQCAGIIFEEKWDLNQGILGSPGLVQPQFLVAASILVFLGFFLLPLPP